MMMLNVVHSYTYQSRSYPIIEYKFVIKCETQKALCTLLQGYLWDPWYIYGGLINALCGIYHHYSFKRKLIP